MRVPGQSGILLMGIFLLAACASRPCPPPIDSYPHRDLWHETWQKYLSVPSRQWTENGDRWFFAREPNATERRFSKMPYEQGMTVLAVKVPNFTDVRLNGCFQTQIIGDQDQNSLYIAGAHDAIQQIPVEIEGDRIYIGQSLGAACPWSLRHVIVRMGVQNLKKLAVYGGGHVEGQNIYSNGLSIRMSGSSDTLLAGSLRVRHIDLTGSGTLTLLGVNSPNLSIEAPGNGNLRLRGNVGISRIHHTGNGNIHIVGANSNHLAICTAGNGITAVRGSVNLTRVTAADSSRVYVTGTNSAYIRVKGSQTAEIGLSGHTDTLELTLKDCARFWGARLDARVTYVSTQNGSHANVLARGRLFAKATDESSIYYSATTGNIAKFVSGRAVILSMGNAFTIWKMSPVWQRTYK